jgi:hypothetical protein
MKIRNYINGIHLLLLGASLGLFSCSDNYLEKLPETDIPESQDFFNTETGLKTFSDGFYNYFDPYIVRDNDNASDNLEYIATPLALRTREYTISTAAGSGGWDWTAIRNVNYFIGRCNASTASADVKNEYRGLAKFFRAYLYFNKVRIFGDVPWYSKPLGTGDDEELYKARDSRELVMDSVLNDLNEAIKYLPETKYHNRISKWTALAYKSRICLYEATWRKYHPSYNLSNAEKFFTEAAKAAGQIIENGPYTLYSTGTPSEDYRMLFLTTPAPTDETILAVSFPQDKTGASFHFDNYWVDYTAGQYGATRSLMEDYFMSDGTSFYNQYTEEERDTLPYYKEVQNRDPRFAATIITPGYVRYGTSDESNFGDFLQNRTGYQICKRVGPEAYYDYRDVILMRYAEVLLNYAEAETELGNCNQELLNKTINLVRERAGLQGRTYPMTTDQHQRDMYKRIADNDNLCEIRHERRVELALEGIRFDDIFRWGEGHLLRETYEGIYLNKGINQLIDLDNDGVNDVSFVREVPGQQQTGITYVSLMDVNGFTKGDEKGGRIIPYNKSYEKWEDWEYLSPIPVEELTLNPNLEQNPGWDNYY